MSPVFKGQLKPGVGDEINLSKVGDLFWQRWYFIPLFLVVSLALCKLYLRYTKPLYQASGSVRIMTQDESPIKDLGLMGDFNNSIDNIESEIQILQSKQLITEAINRLDVGVSYYTVGTLVTTEIYKRSPFKVLYDQESIIPFGRIFQLEYLGGNKIVLTFKEKEEEIKKELVFGEEAVIKGFRFRVIKNEKNANNLSQGITYRWSVNSIDLLVNRVRGGLKIEPMGYMVALLRISLTDYVPDFASDFVNALCLVYQESEMKFKSLAADQALAFIQGQIDTLEKQVKSAEHKLEDFKQDEKGLVYNQKGTMSASKIVEREDFKAQINRSGDALKELRKEIQARQSQLTAIPFYAIGESGAMINGLISSYNDLTLERLKALQKNTLTSPPVKEFDKRIQELSEFILENIDVVLNQNEKDLAFIETELARFREEIRTIPSAERVYGDLDREYKINEEIFSNLLQRRAESSISRASIVSSVRIIDQAAVPFNPISPNVERSYSISVGMGLALSLSLIFLTGLLKNTITYKEEIEAISLTPVIGIVRRSTSNNKAKTPKMVILDNPKSALSESIRSIRTNLQFISSDKKSKVISLTSTVSGEGKSFISINLAGIISLLNRKVILLDLDLRKPKLHLSFGRDNSVGLSTFLVGKSELKDIKQKTEIDNLDIITSGPIPPNPAELLQSLKMELLLMELRKTYDYIIVDTPPVGIVTDGMNLLRLSDVILYVLRSEFSRKPYATFPDQLMEEHKIKNLYIVFNSVSQSGSRYGRYGKYGGYGQAGSGYYVEATEQDPWWKFWRRLKKSG